MTSISDKITTNISLKIGFTPLFFTIITFFDEQFVKIQIKNPNYFYTMCKSNWGSILELKILVIDLIIIICSYNVVFIE